VRHTDGKSTGEIRSLPFQYLRIFFYAYISPYKTEQGILLEISSATRFLQQMALLLLEFNKCQ